jgi:hypothetical protein
MPEHGPLLVRFTGRLGTKQLIESTLRGGAGKTDFEVDIRKP